MPRTRVSLAVVLGVFITASCATVDAGSLRPSTTAISPTTPTSSASTTSTTSTSSTTEAEALPTLADFSSIVDSTVVRPRLRFRVESFFVVPGIEHDIFGTRTGTLDFSTDAGLGTRSFTRYNLDRGEIVREEAVEFRLVDEVFWTYDPIAHPHTWRGFDIDELDDGGAELLAQIAGLHVLDLLLAAAIEVESVEELRPRADEWTLRVRADDLVDLINAPAPAAEAMGPGADMSGLEAQVLVTVVDGVFITDLFVDLGEWWANAVSPSPPAEASDMWVRVTFEIFDYPLTGVAPCQEPVERVEDGVAFFECVS